MIKKLLSLLMAVCLVFGLLPVNALAVQSLNLYVGGTEVTDANCAAITGPGLSGDIRYDPETCTLTLNNATIESNTLLYDDTEQSAIRSHSDELNIVLVGSNRIVMEAPANEDTYKFSILGVGDMTIRGVNGGSLSVENGSSAGSVALYGDKTITIADAKLELNNSAHDSAVMNDGIWCNGLTVTNSELNIHTGTAVNGSCSGIMTFGGQMTAANSRIGITTGESWTNSGIYLLDPSGLEMKNSTLTITLGKSTTLTATGINAESGDVVIEQSDVTIVNGDAYESNVGIICSTGSLTIDRSNVSVKAGGSETFNSYALCALAGDMTILSSDITAISGDAPNASSIAIDLESADTGLTINNSNINASTGTSAYSAAFYIAGSGSFDDSVITAVAGTTVYESAPISEGIYFGDSLLLTRCTITAQGGETVGENGESNGIYGTFSNMRVNESELILSAKTYAMYDVPALNFKYGYQWRTSPDGTFTAGKDQPLTRPDNYQYLHIMSAPATSFVDVENDDYFTDPVVWAVSGGITQGTSATTFSPDDTCTRAQTVTFLWRNAGCPEPESTEMPFTDVEDDDYFYNAVLWAVENGITVGTSDTTFSPEDTVTRAQVVTFLWRADGSPDIVGYNPFTDVESGEYYYTPVLWARLYNITVGTTDTTFGPDDGCTRAQIVTFLWRANGSPAVS